MKTNYALSIEILVQLIENYTEMKNHQSVIFYFKYKQLNDIYKLSSVC